MLIIVPGVPIVWVDAELSIAPNGALLVILPCCAVWLTLPIVTMVAWLFVAVSV